MREIKFRYAYVVGEDGHCDLEYYSILEIERGQTRKELPFSRDQFVGLKDKNGKEIYEGDIVRDIFIPKLIWEIYYDNAEAKFWCKNDTSTEEVLGSWNASDDPAYPDWNNYEVIGNIYENPELLKVEV